MKSAIIAQETPVEENSNEYDTCETRLDFDRRVIESGKALNYNKCTGNFSNSR